MGTLIGATGGARRERIPRNPARKFPGGAGHGQRWMALEVGDDGIPGPDLFPFGPRCLS